MYFRPFWETVNPSSSVNLSVAIVSVPFDTVIANVSSGRSSTVNPVPANVFTTVTSQEIIVFVIVPPLATGSVVLAV